MGKKPYSGTADLGAAVARPNTETTGRLGIELADSSLTHQCCKSVIADYIKYFLKQEQMSAPSALQLPSVSGTDSKLGITTVGPSLQSAPEPISAACIKYVC